MNGEFPRKQTNKRKKKNRKKRKSVTKYSPRLMLAEWFADETRKTIIMNPHVNGSDTQQSRLIESSEWH